MNFKSKPIYQALLIGVFSLCFLPSWQAKAQGEFDQLLEGGLQDATKLIGGYLSPMMEGTSVGLANGWYNTAKPHKIGGVDLTLTFNAVKIPESKLFYDVLALDLQELEPAPGFDGQAPTFFGPDITPTYALQDDASVTINGPPGLDFKNRIRMNFMPVPTLNLGIGLIKNTDLKLRLVPERKLDDLSFKMFGVGVMHDIKQHIPGIKMLPFDMSGFVGYTKATMSIDLSESVPGTNQEASISFSALTVQGLISKKVSVATVYGGLGFNIAKSNMDMLGTYEIDGPSGPETLTDPVALEYAASGPRMTAGFRLKLAVLTLHADYTIQKYSVLSVGLGLSVR